MKYFVLVLCLFPLISCKDDASVLVLKWEGAGSRVVDYRALINISSIKDANEKLSPSVAGYVPDPVLLSGRVVDGDNHPKNMPISLLLPRHMLNGIEANNTVVLGFFGDRIIICVAAANEKQWSNACVTNPALPSVDFNRN